MDFKNVTYALKFRFSFLGFEIVRLPLQFSKTTFLIIKNLCYREMSGKLSEAEREKDIAQEPVLK